MGNLQGKVAIVTGGSSGIGLASAGAFVREGAHVYIFGRRFDALETAAKELGPEATPVQGDVAVRADLDRLVDVVRAAHGRIDIVFANAGASAGAPVGEITDEMYDRLFNVNVRGTLHTVQAALPLMQPGGAIVMTGSIAGSKGRAGRSAYGASKAALRSFARIWAVDLRDRNIRVNLVVPGPTRTGMFAGMSEQAIASLGSQAIRGKVASPEEIAEAVLFLASPLSSFVNGAEFFVDGGAAQI